MLTDSTLRIDPQREASRLEGFIRNTVSHFQRDGVIIGLSGGVDSALVAALCVRALGKDRVLGLIMPEKDTDVRAAQDAQKVAVALEIEAEVVDLTRSLEELGVYQVSPYELLPTRWRGFVTRGVRKMLKAVRAAAFSRGLVQGRGRLGRRIAAYSRIKHRMRLVVLYFYAEQRNLLVVGAANKSEYLTGFFVKQGCDHLADIMPIQHLYKTQVWQMAQFVGLPQEIVERPPQPDITPGGIKDEDILGPYRVLDLVLYGLEKEMSPGDIARELNIGRDRVERVKLRVNNSQQMRDLPYSVR